MVRTSLATLLLVGALTFTAPAARQAQDPPDIAGVYSCQGVNPDGTPYRGVVEIKKNHDTFRVAWVFSSRQGYFGILSGDVLAVSYYTGTIGLVAYKVEGSRLMGKWTVAGADEDLFTETLTKLRAGTLQAHANLPDGLRAAR